MKRFSKRIGIAFVAAFMFTVIGNTESTLGNDSNIVEIEIIAINDFHGALVSSGENDLNPGAPRVVQAVLDRTAQNPNNMVLAAGDMYMGTAISNMFRGEPVSHMLRLINTTASVVGNHEFTWGADQMEIWSGIEEAPFLSANIYELATGGSVSWAKPYIIKEIDGVNIGVLGLTTVNTMYTTSRVHIEHLGFRDPVEVAERYVPLLIEQGADIVVLLTHIGSSQDNETGEVTLEEGTEGLAFIDGVDVIITSHSHRAVAGEINDVPIIQAMHNGRALGIINFVFDRDANELISTDIELDLLHARRHDIAENQEMIEILEQFDIGPMMEQVIGETVYGLYRNDSGVRGELSVLGQWLSEIMIEESGADVAFNNSGGLRTHIEAGEITRGMLHEVMPFDNSIVVLEMTGRQIKEVIAFGTENEGIGQVQFAGVIVEFIPGEDQENRIHSMMFSNGNPVDLDATYLVATNSFMATGGDGFSTFLDGTVVSDEGFVRAMMENAIIEASTLAFIPEVALIPVFPEVEGYVYTSEAYEDLTYIYAEYYNAVEASGYVAPVTLEISGYIVPVTYDVISVEPTVPATYDVISVEPTVPATYDVISVEPTAPVAVPLNVVPTHASVANNTVVIRAGDNLWRISRAHNTTVEAIALHNNLANPNILYIGQVITIPGGSAASRVVGAVGAPITIEEIQKAQRLWGEGLVAISTAFANGEDYATIAQAVLDNLYGYVDGIVLFKPTIASEVPFRFTEADAASYFIGGGIAEDNGFALNRWTAVRFGDDGRFILNGPTALFMGSVFLTDGYGEEIRVEKSLGYYRDSNGVVRIQLHHSSVPFGS